MASDSGPFPCPVCSGPTKVSNTSLVSSGMQIRRYRKCLDCSKTFTTLEVLGAVSPRVGIDVAGLVDPQVCNRCGHQYAYVWSAPDALWNQIADGRSHLCIPCFEYEAESHGLMVTFRAVGGQP